MKLAAITIGIPYTSWRKVAKDEKVPVYQIGGRWYVSRKDLAAFVERHRELLAS
jgi:hypothetical protein